MTQPPQPDPWAAPSPWSPPEGGPPGAPAPPSPPPPGGAFPPPSPPGGVPPPYVPPPGSYGVAPHAAYGYGPGPFGPPAPPRRPVRGGRVAAGVGLALLGHVATVAPLLIAIAVDADGFAGTGLIVLLIAQCVLFLGCLIAGIMLTVRQDGGYGLGVLIGWAVGLLVMPVVGVGACIWALNSMSSVY